MCVRAQVLLLSRSFAPLAVRNIPQSQLQTRRLAECCPPVRDPTLPHEGLAGVEEDLTALDDHALDGQVFPDVLRLTDFIMHDPGEAGGKTGEVGSKRCAVPLSGRGMLAPWADSRGEDDLYLLSASCMSDTAQAPSGLIPRQPKSPGAYFRRTEKEIGASEEGPVIFQC